MNTLDFYRDLQNTCASGYDRITRLLSKAESEKLRTDMICQLEGYQRLSKVAESRLQEARANPQSISLLERFKASLYLTMHTMFDTASPHLAELIACASYKNALSMTRSLHRLQEQEGTQPAVALCQQAIAFEEESVRRMLGYL